MEHVSAIPKKIEINQMFSSRNEQMVDFNSDPSGRFKKNPGFLLSNKRHGLCNRWFAYINAKLHIS